MNYIFKIEDDRASRDYYKRREKYSSRPQSADERKIDIINWGKRVRGNGYYVWTGRVLTLLDRAKLCTQFSPHIPLVAARRLYNNVCSMMMCVMFICSSHHSLDKSKLRVVSDKNQERIE